MMGVRVAGLAGCRAGPLADPCRSTLHRPDRTKSGRRDPLKTPPLPGTPRVRPGHEARRPGGPGRWGDAGVVGGFEKAPANPVLLDFVRAEIQRRPGLRVLDLGCGAARNAAPIAALGALVIGIDVVRPMLDAARRRVASPEATGRVFLALAPMDRLPLHDASIDLVVAHGIWNLAGSAAEFRRAVAEAARVARPGAGLFVFTFSRSTLAPDDQPLPGEGFVFTQFANEPQCFLTEAELKEELLRVGFEKDPPGPLTEYNRPAAGHTLSRTGPVIFEGTFRAAGRPWRGNINVD